MSLIRPRAIVTPAGDTNAALRAYAVGDGLGVLKPSSDTCGTLPGVSRATVSGNVTLTSSNSPYTDRTVTGRITISGGHHVVIRNVQAMDLQCEQLNASCEVYDSAFVGSLPSVFTNGGAVVGHDIYMERCRLSGHIDGWVIRNNPLWNNGAGPDDYDSGCDFRHCWVDRLVYWTGTAGTVHPSDTWSHNDGIQHMGGWGTVMTGCWIDANWAHQAGHWLTVGGSEVEPYTGVAVGSLDGTLPLWQIPDRGSGTNATGRYNSDSTGDGTKSVSLSGILLGNNVGTTRDFHYVNGWISGGDLPVNGGGFNRGAETNFLCEITGNRFGRDRGNQGVDPIEAGFGSGWVGSIYTDLSGNTYEDDGSPT